MKKSPIKKTSHFLFTGDDERRFSLSIKERYPDAVFIDGIRWPSPTPPTKPLLSDCQEKWAFLWNPGIYPVLPFEKTSDGRFRGPQAGLVIQIERPRADDLTMLSGYIALGITAEREGVAEMIEFGEYVWKVFKKSGVSKALQVDPSSRQPVRVRRDILVGTGAAEWCLASSERYFLFNNASIYMRPVN